MNGYYSHLTPELILIDRIAYLEIRRCGRPKPGQIGIVKRMHRRLVFLALNDGSLREGDLR